MQKRVCDPYAAPPGNVGQTNLVLFKLALETTEAAWSIGDPSPMTRIALFASGLATIAFALMAGFFYTYSISVMPGLDAAPPRSAIEAMQGINIEVRNAWFASAFFGALPLSVVAVLLLWLTGQRLKAILMLAALAAYVAGTFMVTVSTNVPLNEALAALIVTQDLDVATVWADYSQEWTAANHIRAISACLAALLAAAASFATARAVTS